MTQATQNTKENLNEKTFFIHILSHGQPRYFYNEGENRFIDSEQEKATLYTKEDACIKYYELIEPLIDNYQKTGQNYTEIHVRNIFGKHNIL